MKINPLESDSDDSTTLNLGIHCNLLDEMNGADLVDLKGEGKSKNISRVITYVVNSFPSEFRDDYMAPQYYSQNQMQNRYSDKNYVQNQYYSTSNQRQSTYPDSYQQISYPDNTQGVTYISQNRYKPSPNLIQSNLNSEAIQHTVYGDIPVNPT